MPDEDQPGGDDGSTRPAPAPETGDDEERPPPRFRDFGDQLEQRFSDLDELERRVDKLERRFLDDPGARP